METSRNQDPKHSSSSAELRGTVDKKVQLLPDGTEMKENYFSQSEEKRGGAVPMQSEPGRIR